jgi:hypothetical protein
VKALSAIAAYTHGKNDKIKKLDEWLEKKGFSTILDSYLEHGDGGKGQDG